MKRLLSLAFATGLLAACGSKTCPDGDGLIDCANPSCEGVACGAQSECSERSCSSGACTVSFRTGEVCRPAAGPCDEEERCEDGMQTCPPDTVIASQTPCGQDKNHPSVPAACDGVHPQCPEYAEAAPCSTQGPCCVYGFGAVSGEWRLRVQPLGTVCRPANFECDVEEVCDGVSAQCPADAFLPQGTVCRESVGECDVPDVCSGTSPGCADWFLGPLSLCRPAASPCELTAYCDGRSALCPESELKPWGAVCREPTSPCDQPEVCNGRGPDCPPPNDAAAPTWTVCRSAQGACDAPEFCDGESLDCPAEALTPAAAGTVCRAAADGCDEVEVCDGASLDCGTDGFVAEGTTCGSGATCSGESASCSQWHLERPPARFWMEVYSVAADDVWIASSEGTFAHWDGIGWTSMEGVGVERCLVGFDALWASAKDDVWAAGGLLQHWDGKAWQAVGKTGHEYTALWGSSSEDLWAVGDCGIAHRSGDSWQTMFVEQSFLGIWGSSSSDVWAVGAYAWARSESGLFHFDGQVWTPFEYGREKIFGAVHGTGATDVWFGAWTGEVTHFDGNEWTLAGSLDESITRLFATPTRVFCTTQAGRLWVLNRASGVWRLVFDRNPGWPLTGLSVVSADDIWLVGDGRLWRGNGVSWRELASRTSADVVSVVALPDAAGVYAGGGKEILRDIHGVWESVDTPPLDSMDGLYVPGVGDVWEFGTQGSAGSQTPAIAHRSGASWTSYSAPQVVRAMWGSGASDVWAVGEGGLAWHWTGVAWAEETTKVIASLRAVIGTSARDVWAAGDHGVMLHWDGVVWSPVATGRKRDIRALAVAPGGLVVLESEASATTLGLWDGVAWTEVGSIAGDFEAMWRKSADDVWMAGGSGIAHWDGASLVQAQVPAVVPALKSITGNEQGEVWAVGDRGTILHLSR